MFQLDFVHFICFKIHHPGTMVQCFKEDTTLASLVKVGVFIGGHFQGIQNSDSQPLSVAA